MNKKLIDRAKEFCNKWNEPTDEVENSRSISIVIPVYHPEHLKEVLLHLRKIGGYKEIILVDDSGEVEKDNYSYLENWDDVVVVYHSENLGRPAARNTGATYANGDILVFMDQDMFLDPIFLSTAKKYYSVNDSLVFLGLRETVPFEEIPSLEDWNSPDIKKDWRIQTTVLPQFVDLTVLNVGGISNRCNPNEDLSIVEKTDNLKQLGILSNNTVGFWDLPSMVVSHTMAIKKKDYFEIGGFPEWIQGWGGEDIVLGYLSCSAHIPIYLSRCISYQAYHKPYSGSEEAKNEELDYNITYYRNWAQSIEEFPKFDFSVIKKRCNK